MELRRVSDCVRRCVWVAYLELEWHEEEAEPYLAMVERLEVGCIWVTVYCKAVKFSMGARCLEELL